MTKVYDCFCFSGEWDMLELRLHTHAPVVDYFVVVESNYTFTGVRKSLQFDINSPRLAAFESKIRYVLVNDMPNSGWAWANEHHQRNALMRALWDAEPQDLIIINDVDEIIRPWLISSARDLADFSLFGWQQSLYYCFMNNVCTTPSAQRFWSVAVRKHCLAVHSPDWYRERMFTREAGEVYWWPNAGWHYSFMMDQASIVRKVQSFSHTELNTPDVINNLDPHSAAKQGRDLLGREHMNWRLLPLEGLDCPDYVLQKPDVYSKYLLDPNAKAS